MECMRRWSLMRKQTSCELWIDILNLWSGMKPTNAVYHGASGRIEENNGSYEKPQVLVVARARLISIRAQRCKADRAPASIHVPRAAALTCVYYIDFSINTEPLTSRWISRINRPTNRRISSIFLYTTRAWKSIFPWANKKCVFRKIFSLGKINNWDSFYFWYSWADVKPRVSKMSQACPKNNHPLVEPIDRRISY